MSRLGDGLRANPLRMLIAGAIVLVGAAATVLEDFGVVRREAAALVCGDEADALARRVEGLEDRIRIFQRVGFRKDGETVVALEDLHTRDRQEAIDSGATRLYGGRVYALSGGRYRHHRVPAGLSVKLLNEAVDLDAVEIPPGAPVEHVWTLDAFEPVVWHFERPRPDDVAPGAEGEATRPDGRDPYVTRIAPFVAVQEIDVRDWPSEPRTDHARRIFFDAIRSKLETADTLLVNLQLRRVREIEDVIYFAQFRAAGWAQFGEAPVELLEVHEFLAVTSTDDRIYLIKSAHGVRDARPDLGAEHEALVMAWWKALRIID